MWPFRIRDQDLAEIYGMVDALKKDIPPDLTVNKMQALSVNKTTRVIERMVANFQKFDESRKFGYFSRVRIIHKTKWCLRDAGYSPEFVQLVVESILSVTIKTKKEKVI